MIFFFFFFSVAEQRNWSAWIPLPDMLVNKENILIFLSVFPELALTAILGNTYFERHFHSLLNTSPTTPPLDGTNA